MNWLEFCCMMKLRTTLGKKVENEAFFYQWQIKQKQYSHPWKELDGWWIQAIGNYNFSSAYMHWTFQWNQTKNYITWSSKEHHQHHGGRQWNFFWQLLRICVVIKSWYSITFWRMFKMKMVILKLKLHAKRTFPQSCWEM
jgi:hypothetical protein